MISNFIHQTVCLISMQIMLTDLSIMQINRKWSDLPYPLVDKEYKNLNTNTRLYGFKLPFLNVYRQWSMTYFTHAMTQLYINSIVIRSRSI